MKRHLLIFTWEYYGYHSKQGTALSKRSRQVAESFKINDWDVTVIHKDQINESKENAYSVNIENGVRRISVKQTNNSDYNKNVFLRKIETLYYLTFHGDRTYNWATDVISNFPDFHINKPSVIISFFTPRVPLYLGNYFSHKLNIPWIADLQDPIYEGVSKEARFLCRFWMKRILSSAKSIVHISPEWAKIDAQLINKDIYTIRHAIPENKVENLSVNDIDHLENNTFYIFYGGSITPSIQSVALLKQTISSLGPTPVNIQILVAGDTSVYEYFKTEIGEKYVKHLGWLTYDVMIRYIERSNCTLVIPWSKERIGIPSKFYELCNYKKPIWIIGDDLGAFTTLLNEWQHPQIEINDLFYQKKTLTSAMSNDYQYMFNLDSCKGEYITSSNLYKEYKKVI